MEGASELPPASAAAQPSALEAAATVAPQDGQIASGPSSNGHTRENLLVFGLAEHIQQVRKRRARPAAASPKPRPGNRTDVQHIPSLDEMSQQTPAPVPPTLVTLSLWDHLATLAEDEGETVNRLPVPTTTTFQAMSLWAD
jgi:hypothetical protein